MIGLSVENDEGGGDAVDAVTRFGQSLAAAALTLGIGVALGYAATKAWIEAFSG